MSKSKKNSAPAKKNRKGMFTALGIAAAALVVFMAIKTFAGPDSLLSSTISQNGGDIQITKSQITEKASFLSYAADTAAMEVIAVKAPDGTIRTALNTCQVCYNSGRGYYVQEGDELVCQNCGNRFKISQIELEKNGCNPVPIPEESKTDDGQTITIPESYLQQNADLFLKWKR